MSFKKKGKEGLELEEQTTYSSFSNTCISSLFGYVWIDRNLAEWNGTKQN
jgi:hypothetical protein